MIEFEKTNVFVIILFYDGDHNFCEGIFHNGGIHVLMTMAKLAIKVSLQNLYGMSKFIIMVKTEFTLFLHYHIPAENYLSLSQSDYIRKQRLHSKFSHTK